MSQQPDLETDVDALGMRVGLRTRTLSDERLAFIKQIGVDDVFVDPFQEGDVFGDTEADFDDDVTITVDDGVTPSVNDLIQARRRAEDAGLRVAGIQSLGYEVYGKIMRDAEGQDAQLAAIKRLVRNLGQADIPILGYQWNPRGVVPMRTSRTARLRGGAQSSAFDVEDINDPYEPVDDLEREYTEEEFWTNYEHFLEEVLPVAEEAGVRLALHPADPPTVEQLGGLPRLFRDVEAFERAMDLVPSDAHGLKLCLGCFSEMPDVDVLDVIRTFGERDDIVFVHFRDVLGTWPAFQETFIDDEDSNFDPLEAVHALHDVGFEGVLVPDHVPDIIDDTDWGHRARAHATAYMKGLVRCAHHRG